MQNKEQEKLIEMFWERVAEVSPQDVVSGTVRVVSNGDIKWLIEQLQPKTTSTDIEELKKEAVRGFAKWLDLDKEAVYNMPHFIQEWAEEYLSSNEKNSKLGGKE